jgi:para-aminobenzoate synthetase component 1
MTPATEGRTLMNELGAKREPFIFAIDFELQKPLIVTEKEAQEAGIRFSFNGVTNGPAGKHPSRAFRFSRKPVPFETYLQAFTVVMDRIRHGDSYLVNLTFPTPLETDLTLGEIYDRSNAMYSMLYQDRFAVFSPESFVRIRDGVISSFPMKGTIDAALPDAREALLNSAKELAEHNTIVDLIRNDLSIMAKEVRVQRFRYVDTIRTNFKELLQVSSEITGILESDYPSRIGDILFSMLPAGSVSGAPKKRTVEIIREAEGAPRGYYTGVMGRFDGHDLDSGVMIRFIEQTAQGLVFRSGGGVTCFSDPLAEYNEMIDKVYVPFV